jgi:hypothetical protein
VVSDPVTGGKHGDVVMAVLVDAILAKDEIRFLGRLEQTTCGQYPNKVENWYLCGPGFMPRLVTELHEQGYSFHVIPNGAEFCRWMPWEQSRDYARR